MPDAPQTWTTLRTLLLISVAYALADLAINQLAFSEGWKILWPLNGFSVAILISRPRREWAALLLAIQAGTAVGEYFDGNAVVYELVQRLFSASEVLLCALLLPAFSSLEAWLRSTHFLRRLLAALLIGPGLSGIAAATYVAQHTGESFSAAFSDWAMADALGIAVTLPLALAWKSRPMRKALAPAQLPAFTGAMLLVLAVCGLTQTVSSYPLLFLLYPTLLFVDLLLGIAGSALAILLVAMVSVICATHGYGPFGNWPADLFVSRDHALQVFLGFHAILILPASILIMEHRRLTAELGLSNARLTELASRDGLTGLANRRAFDERLETHWERATARGESIALVVIDLDNFKAYNDLYGHAAGDAILRTAAQAIAHVLDRDEEFVARFGGEEFVAILPNTDEFGARATAESLREAVYALAIPHTGNSLGRVSVSIGYAAVRPDRNDQPVSLIQLADAALYKAKAAGRNCVLTISTEDALKGAKQQFGETTRLRLRRLIGLGQSGK